MLKSVSSVLVQYKQELLNRTRYCDGKTVIETVNANMSYLKDLPTNSVDSLSDVIKRLVYSDNDFDKCLTGKAIYVPFADVSSVEGTDLREISNFLFYYQGDNYVYDVHARLKSVGLSAKMFSEIEEVFSDNVVDLCILLKTLFELEETVIKPYVKDYETLLRLYYNQLQTGRAEVFSSDILCLCIIDDIQLPHLHQSLLNTLRDIHEIEALLDRPIRSWVRLIEVTEHLKAVGDSIYNLILMTLVDESTLYTYIGMDLSPIELVVIANLHVKHSADMVTNMLEDIGSNLLNKQEYLCHLNKLRELPENEAYNQ